MSVNHISFIKIKIITLIHELFSSNSKCYNATLILWIIPMSFYNQQFTITIKPLKINTLNGGLSA